METNNNTEKFARTVSNLRKLGVISKDDTIALIYDEGRTSSKTNPKLNLVICFSEKNAGTRKKTTKHALEEIFERGSIKFAEDENKLIATVSTF